MVPLRPILTAISLLSLLLCLEGLSGFSQEKKEAEEDEKAKKLIGTFQYPLDTMVGFTRIAREKDVWTVAGMFKKKDKTVGAFEGTKVQYRDGVLTFRQKYVTRPRNYLIDNEKFTIKILAENVIAVPE